jgi:hypothetical protein
MTKNRSRHPLMAVFLSVGVLSMTACGAGSGGNHTFSMDGPGVTPALEAAAALNAAGQFKGSVTDSAFKKGTTNIIVSQHGRSVGGAMRSKYSAKSVNAVVAWTLDPSTGGLQGTAVATIGNAACTFAISATYDSKTLILAGTYKAVHGCNGESGIYTTKEQCYYVNHATTMDVKPHPIGLRPC